MFDDTDPRTTGEHVRRLPGRADTGDLYLTGVVHDHPASIHRVRAVVGAVDPAVVALELPPLAVPLFERYADDGRTPPADGGEMSAAIQAARTDAVVGIDGPTPAFVWRLARTVRRAGVDAAAVRSLLAGLRSVTAHAVACRVAATAGRGAVGWLPVDDPVEHGCDRFDAPARQAADERETIRRSETVSAAFSRSGARRLRDAAREAYMAERLAELRERGSVVAVVGTGHLDAVADRLG